MWAIRELSGKRNWRVNANYYYNFQDAFDVAPMNSFIKKVEIVELPKNTLL